MTEHITYRDGYKYQLCEGYSVLTNLKPAAFIFTEFVRLDTDGTLSIADGYAWDGPSGPTIDTPDFMRGSLVHDALYQLMREKHLDHATYRELADKELKKICLEDGMPGFRAEYVYQGVRAFGDPSADPAKSKPPITAP